MALLTEAGEMTKEDGVRYLRPFLIFLSTSLFFRAFLYHSKSFYVIPSLSMSF